jgi:hypothetical protein
MFTEGSLLFCLGAAFSMSTLPERAEGNELAIVSTTYLAGSICFELGAYAGLL